MSRLLGERPVARRVPCESHVKKLVAKKQVCAGGRLRPDGLLIVSILYAGVSLEICDRKIQVLRWGTSSAGEPLIVCIL